MKPQIRTRMALLKRIFFTAFVLGGASASLLAQGYMYTFEGVFGNQLDGSYVILSRVVPGAPTLADLLAVKILDSYPGPGATAFDVTVTAAGFNVTSFDAQRFNGSISGSAQSYFPPTGVTLAGMDSTPGITASNNGFFPGNPQGEAVFGNWVVTPVPEPNPLSLILIGVAGLAVRRKRLKGHAAEAAHLGKGILERDLESRFPDPNTEIIMYCGGGFRSILTADVAQRMGYRNCHSLIGGYKALVQSGWPMKKGAA